MPDALAADARQLVDLTADVRALARRIANRAAKHASLATEDRARFASRLLHARARRANLLPDICFGEPAWDMLLELYVASAERRAVTVSSLCHAAHVPSTTALRWIGLLVQADYIRRFPDPDDGRRVLTGLTERGRTALDSWIDDAAAMGLV